MDVSGYKVIIDSMGIELAIPQYIADWLKKASEKQIKIFWCTDPSTYTWFAN